VKWLNDPAVNRFLHYDLPLCEDRTLNWYNRIINDPSRVDFAIDVLEGDQIFTVGLIGLLNIDHRNRKAEFYITLGDTAFQGRGIAYHAGRQFIDYSFKRFNLNKIYLYTEEQNEKAQRLFERLGFTREGLLKEDLIYMGRPINRYIYGLLREVFYREENRSTSL